MQIAIGSDNTEAALSPMPLLGLSSFGVNVLKLQPVSNASPASPLGMLHRQANVLGERVRSATLWLSCGEPEFIRRLQPAWVGSPSLQLHLPTGVGPVGWLTRAALGAAICEFYVPRIVVCGHSNCAVEEASAHTRVAASGTTQGHDLIARTRHAQANLRHGKARVAEMVHEIRRIWSDSVAAGELEVGGLFYLPESSTLLRFDPEMDGYQVVED